MPSLTKFTIELDRPGAVYQVGELVTGKIIVNTSEDKSVRGIYFVAKGSAFLHWEIPTLDEMKDHVVSVDYFRIAGYVFGSSKPDSSIELKEGYHQYPFKLRLPRDIPSSFEDQCGYVRYTVKAIIGRSWKFDHECKIAFSVVSVLDLNVHRHRCLGIDEEIRKNFSCCYFGLGSMNTSIRVPSSGYVPGQMISASLSYKNTSSKVGITKIDLKLDRVLIVHTTPKRVIGKCEIISSSYTGPFTAQSVINLEIRVPPTPPSHHLICGIIDLVYYLKVVVHFTGTHPELQKNYPLLIGTIPLNCAPSAPAIQQKNAKPYSTEQPATSSTISMPETPQPSTSTDNSLDHANSSANRNIPPPTYEECMLGAQNIRDDDESDHVQGANAPFRPKYPVFNYPAPSAP